MTSKRIAVIGSGISGLVAAHYLSRKHEVYVYEAGAEIGGHTATKKIQHQGQDYAIDTGFIVFNDRTYPNFIKLLNALQVDYQKTNMGFSVSCQKTGVEYSGTSLKGLFAQVKNIMNWQYWTMLRDILRFNRSCIRLYETGQIPIELTLGEYLEQQVYGDYFKNLYILPMVSAIWSSGNNNAAAMPLEFFVRFFYNHGLLTIFNQPQWYSIKGGSHSYLEPLTLAFKNNIFCDTKVVSVRRCDKQVLITTESRGEEIYDQVIFSCHSDQALSLLNDPTDDEQRILSAITYRENDVCLHHDIQSLPKSKVAWASWNYLNLADQDKTVLTYNMNILQNISSSTTFCVTIYPSGSNNPNANSLVAQNKIFGRYRYSHPVFTKEAVAAQQDWSMISGVNNSHYCGAYWRNGFHEDGVVSALRVVDYFERYYS